MFDTLLRTLGLKKKSVDLNLLVQLKDKPLETIAAELSKRQQEIERTSVRIGMIGMTGAGKSTLVNALIGRQVATTGSITVDHSLDGEEHQAGNVTFVDLPGAGAVNRPAATYVRDLQLLEPGRYDGFLLVTANRLTENDVRLYNELHVVGKKLFLVVRTHFDAALRSNPTLDEDSVRGQIDGFFRQHLALKPAERVYMVSSLQPERFDLPLLLSDLVKSLPDIKALRMLEMIPAYTEDLLKKKRQAVEELVFVRATLAAANGLNPIPGLDIAVDLTLVTKMTQEVVSAFGLTRNQLENWAKMQVGGLPLDQVLNLAAPVMSRLATAGMVSMFREASSEALSLGARKGTGYMAKYGAKYAPIVGQLVSVGVNFGASYLYGHYLLNECEDVARKLLRAQRQQAREETLRA